MGNSPLHSRILVLGIDGSGKTRFLNKYEHPNQDIKTDPTEAYVVRDLKVKGVKFNVWDVSGKESTRSLWKHYYSEGGTDAVIWVVDASSNDKKLEESKNCLNGAMMDPSLAGVVLLVLANKQDVEGAKSAEEIAKILNVQAQQEKRTCLVQGISAKTGDGIKEALESLAKALKNESKKKSN